MRSGKYYQGKKVDGKKRDVHRFTMEEHLGRKFSSDEVVHHINGNKNDNRLENLQLMSRAEHSRLHSAKTLNSESARAKSAEARRGIPNPHRKLTMRQLENARAKVSGGESIRSVAKKYKIDHVTLMLALSGKTYKNPLQRDIKNGYISKVEVARTLSN